MDTKRRKSGGAAAPFDLPLSAEPVQSLLYAADVFGSGFERRVPPNLLQEAAENAASLHLRVSVAIKLFRRFARGVKDPQVKASIEFLTELRDDLGLVARNAQDAWRRHQGVRRG